MGTTAGTTVIVTRSVSVKEVSMACVAVIVSVTIRSAESIGSGVSCSLGRVTVAVRVVVANGVTPTGRLSVF